MYLFLVMFEALHMQLILGDWLGLFFGKLVQIKEQRSRNAAESDRIAGKDKNKMIKYGRLLGESAL